MSVMLLNITNIAYVGNAKSLTDARLTLLGMTVAGVGVVRIGDRLKGDTFMDPYNCTL